MDGELISNDGDAGLNVSASTGQVGSASEQAANPYDPHPKSGTFKPKRQGYTWSTPPPKLGQPPKYAAGDNCKGFDWWSGYDARLTGLYANDGRKAWLFYGEYNPETKETKWGEAHEGSPREIDGVLSNRFGCAAPKVEYPKAKESRHKFRLLGQPDKNAPITHPLAKLRPNLEKQFPV